MEKSRLILKRLLALAALVLAVVLIFVIVGNNTGSDDGGKGGAKTGKKDGSNQKPKTKKNVYVIKEGDTLTAIAASTGIPVERLQALNPDLDPQTLISGQSLKLR